MWSPNLPRSIFLGENDEKTSRVFRLAHFWTSPKVSWEISKPVGNLGKLFGDSLVPPWLCLMSKCPSPFEAPSQHPLAANASCTWTRGTDTVTGFLRFLLSELVITKNKNNNHHHHRDNHHDIHDHRRGTRYPHHSLAFPATMPSFPPTPSPGTKNGGCSCWLCPASQSVCIILHPGVYIYILCM